MVNETLVIGLAAVMAAGFLISTLHPDTDGFAWWLRQLSRIHISVDPAGEGRATPPGEGRG